MSDEQPSPKLETPAKPKGGRPRQHGYRQLRDSIKTLTLRRLDGRSRVAIAVKTFRDDLVRDLGGDPSRAQLAIIEAVSKTWLMLSSLDDWLTRQPSIVNAKKRTLLPIVLQRQQLADSLLRHLTALGLERRAKKVLDARQMAGLPD
jgi:hypothetical protein